MLIAQLSDIHVGGIRYHEELLRTAVDEVNAAKPELVVVAGDLTDDGYPDQYPLAAQELAALDCPHVVRVPGNHDARNVGYLRYEDTFGPRDSRLRLDCGGQDVALVAVDSSKPDLDEGEIGREHYAWIEEGFAADTDLRIFVCHHHLVPVPGLGVSAIRCWMPATSSRCYASAASTSYSRDTGTCLMYGRSRGCCSSTPVRSQPTARGGSLTPRTT